jgi:hypothetical protein
VDTGRTNLPPLRWNVAATRRHSRAHVTAALIVVVALSAVLAGCSSSSGGPGEDQLLPERDLVFPGATALSSEFTEEYHGRKLDGPKVDTPAHLYTGFLAPEGTTFPDVASWYRQQLEPKGWQVIQPLPVESQIVFLRTTDGFEHRIRVDLPGGPPERYSVLYEIREHA